MSSELRFDVADQRIQYSGKRQDYPFSQGRIVEFNLHHGQVLDAYDLELTGGVAICLDDRLNPKSNLGALRNRKLRESVVSSAALSAIAVALHGRGALNDIPRECH